MGLTLDYLKTFAAFPFAAGRFARLRPLTLAQAQQTVRERINQREANFLKLVERGVFGWPKSPYLPLLRQAGCELGDLRTLVNAKGLDAALRDLREAGVYVAFEEFKGRKPIVRGNLELPVSGRDFDNPFARRDFIQETGGSTGAAQAVAADLDFVAARAAQRMVVQAAHGILGAPSAAWQGILPAPGARTMLFGHVMGNVPKRWFSPIGPRDSREWVKYGLGTYYMVLCMRLVGMPVPFPEYVTIEQAEVIVRWLAETVKKDGRATIRAGVSRAVRLSQIAKAAGIDLTGATLSGGGEPPTLAKVSQITATGAKFLPSYGMSDAGQLGSGCVHPVDSCDVHLFRDSVALISHPHWVEGFDVSVPAFIITSLLPSAPKLLLNVESDDYGILEERSCGCELEGYGYTTHVREIRSYSKLTGEGVTLIGNEMVRLLEEVLPTRFGGSPVDYQMMEAEDEQGFTRLYLTIHPRVTITDEQAVIECVLEGLRRSSPMADVARLVWQQSGTLQIRRAEPVWTGRGKLMHLHVARRNPSAAQK